MSGFDEFWNQLAETTPHYVYKLYDADGALLYVGETQDVRGRMKRHHADKPWTDEVAKMDVEEYPNRRFALDRESDLIERIGPVFNISVNGALANATRYYMRRLYGKDPEKADRYAAYMDVKVPPEVYASSPFPEATRKPDLRRLGGAS